MVFTGPLRHSAHSWPRSLLQHACGPSAAHRPRPARPLALPPPAAAGEARGRWWRLVCGDRGQARALVSPTCRRHTPPPAAAHLPRSRHT